MKILLTGSTGFLGKNIKYLLEEYGHEVISPRSPDFLQNWDMLKDSSRREVFRYGVPEVVVHAAWGVGGTNYRESEVNLDWRDASVLLYKEAAEYGVQHFIALGTFSENEGDLMSGDNHDNSRYAESKRQTRSKIFGLEQQLSVPVSWLRIQYPYGYWDRPNRLVSMIIQKSIMREDFTLNSPNLVLDFIHSLDVASAVLETIEKRVFGILEVKSGMKYSLQEVKNIIEKLLAQTSDKNINIDSLIKHIKIDRKEKKWKSSVPLELGLTATITNLKIREEKN